MALRVAATMIAAVFWKGGAMSTNPGEPSSPWEEREVAAAASAAGAIGGRAVYEGLDPAERPVAEAGGGEAEGVELAQARAAGGARRRLQPRHARERPHPPRGRARAPGGPVRRGRPRALRRGRR